MTPQELEEFAARYLEQIDNEINFFALIEAPPEIVPMLVSAFRTEPDPARRSQLLHVLWQRRELSALPVLIEALCDPSTEVWREALDGLVTLGCPESVAAIEQALKPQVPDNCDTVEFHEYLVEALEQLRSGPFGRDGG